ncbi:glycosyl hydrolase [Lindgomyces ingoldianus]|uniref:Glycosyl hydrolase n=1 Tax=Lindgomyces ingoldianus TaxID=673940 RepID=A0ACB6QKD6_9PLEO|nr:glycosyl hydrolase [Lindgomyces ingoldianus]KAF2467370.1 glycosyl hydrolase [Lindgomyces ingoldianus]
MANSDPFKVLVFSKTSAYRHASIPAGIAAIKALADRTKLFTVEASENAETSMTSSLERYAVVVLLHCSGNFLDTAQVDALKKFVQSGGGVVGIHGAAAGLYNNEWYGALIGAHFDMHPDPEPGRVLVEQTGEGIISVAHGRDNWMDEWYNFRTHPRENKNLGVLLKGDTTSFQGGKMGEDHPLAWCQEFDGGRSFYTALGHFDEAYADEWYMDQILKGILWVAKRQA